MKIIEYEDKYLEDVKDLLVELEEYILTIDKDNLDQLHPEYRDKMAILDLEEVNNNNGKCYLAVENNKVVGLIMGYVRTYDEYDYLDYKCPIMVNPNYIGNGYQRQMMKILDEYCKSINKKYIFTKVCSDNVYSLNNMLKDNYVVTDEYENERGKNTTLLKELD